MNAIKIPELYKVRFPQERYKGANFFFPEQAKTSIYVKKIICFITIKTKNDSLGGTVVN
jgi:hypothetical protein